MYNESIHLREIAKKLNSVSWEIISMLSENKYFTYKDIRDALGGKQDKANKEIARLEGAMLIESKKDDGDERKKVFTLTEYGYSILKYKEGREEY